MRVIIASSSVPVIDGGARRISNWTAEAIRAEGHQVEEYFLPFPRGPRPTLSALVGMRATPFAGSGDRLITIRWPAHLLRHDNKVSWFIHHYRELFDLWGTRHMGVSANGEGVAFREALRRVDNLALRECREVFSNSHIVRDRIREYNGLDVEPLFPPLGGDVSRFRTDSYGDFIFYPSRITPIKRQMLAVQAMRYTTTPVRLVVAGKPESPGYVRYMRDFVREHGLEERVDLRFGWMAEDEKVDLLAACLAVAYLPVNEDSYGYVSLEASHSAKPIVTLTDAGGTLEFVRDEHEGFVREAQPRQLAEVFDRLHEDRGEAERLGAQSLERRAELNIAWPHVVRRLLGEDS